MLFSKVILVTGAQATGKSRYVREHFPTACELGSFDTAIVHVSPDTLIVELLTTAPTLTVQTFLLRDEYTSYCRELQIACAELPKIITPLKSAARSADIREEMIRPHTVLDALKRFHGVEELLARLLRRMQA